MTEFSRTHLPDEVVRSPEAVARYIAHTFNLSEVVEWPEDALLAAWRLGGLRFHYTRTAGSFGEWRAANRETPDPHHQALLRERRRNRAEARYTGKAWDYQDRRLVYARLALQREGHPRFALPACSLPSADRRSPS